MKNKPDFKVDAYIITSSHNRFYFSDVQTSFGCCVLTKTKNYFFTDFRYKLLAETTLSSDFELKIIKGNMLNESIKEALHEANVKTVGYEDEFLTYADYKKLKAELSGYTLKAVSADLDALRAIKTDEEIDRILKAEKINEAALTLTLQAIKPGMTEQTVMAELVYNLLAKGSEMLAFDPIVASGKNAAKPHHVPSNKEIEKNELILFDFGARYKGYCSDISRTLTFGTPSKEAERAYNYVLQAQAYALKNIKAGMTCREADSFAREFLLANGYGNDYFGHSLGHGVGIKIHEAPAVSPNSDTVLLPNMIITIEPGVYIDGVCGVRIEDMAVVTENGLTNLTSFHKNIHV